MFDRQQLAEYIQMELEGTLGDEQFAELTALLKSSAEARRYYSRTITAISILRENATAGGSAAEGSFDAALWQTLSQYEKDAEPLAAPEPSREVITGVRLRKEMMTKTGRPKLAMSFWVSLGSIAALLMMVTYVMIHPRAAEPVATVTDTCRAAWLQSGPETGSRLGTEHSPLVLLSGYAQLRFDSGTEVTIEGPAEFQVIAEDRLDMRRGKIYAIVPQEAIGFSIYTKNSRIIDLGTEFGVDVDSAGGTSLHVTNGSTRLIAGEKSGKKVSVEVVKGIAKKISAELSEISDIPCEAGLFVRSFNSANTCVWKGQTRLDLADIVGGGSGFGNSQDCVGIDPATGKRIDTLRYFHRPTEKSGYHEVSDVPFIDGVFVPQGSGRQIISTKGHVFKDCPVTNGIYWMEISNRPMTSSLGAMDGQGTDIHRMQLNGIEYGTAEHPAIMMHPNVGITFDLDEIRATIPGHVKVSRFVSLAGLSDKTTIYQANAVLWVLLDGQVAGRVTLARLGLKEQAIDVAIDETKRFLTLAVTEGENGLAEDWIFFANPTLVLE